MLFQFQELLFCQCVYKVSRSPISYDPYKNQSGNCHWELIDWFLSDPQEYQNHESQYIYQ